MEIILFFWWSRWTIWTTRKSVEFSFYFMILRMETFCFYDLCLIELHILDLRHELFSLKISVDPIKSEHDGDLTDQVAAHLNYCLKYRVECLGMV